MDFSRLKKLVVHEGVVKKVEIGGKAVWQAEAKIPFAALPVGYTWTFTNVPYTYLNENNATVSATYSGVMRVADCDYYLNTGDIPLTTHHVVVVPNKAMFTANMNASVITKGGYVGSKMYTTYLRRAEAIFKACFGENHVLSHREYLVNKVTNGKEAGGAWYTRLVDLMDERMVFGSANYANTSLTSISNRRLRLFEENPELGWPKFGSWYWLRNVYNDEAFAIVATSDYNYRTYNASILSRRVHPYALIY